MYDNLPKYRGYLVRHPASPEQAIDARPFGYLSPEAAEQRREARRSVRGTGLILEDGRMGYRNSEARKRFENQPEHPCYAPQGEHAIG